MRASFASLVTWATCACVVGCAARVGTADEVGEGESSGESTASSDLDPSESESSATAASESGTTEAESESSESDASASASESSEVESSESASESDSTGGQGCAGFASNLPIVQIDTGGQFIPDEPKIPAELIILDAGEGQINCSTDAPAFVGPIGIETRGSTSQQYPKKSFGIETRDMLGDDLDVAILGMPPESDWVLYGPYPDKTLIRNSLTFFLHREMGHYSSRTRHVEVVLDGEYWGVYEWMERIKRGPDRVAISDIDPVDVAGDALTGGYILKVDKLTGELGHTWVSPYSAEVTLQVDYPKAGDIVPEQAAYIQAAVTQFEDALAGPQFADPLVGYPAWIDVESFLDFMILQELGRTVDGYRSSSFFFKDRESLGGKFVAGPMWDFNLSYGNADYCDAFSTSGYQYEFELVCGAEFMVEVPFWWARLREDPAFDDALRCRWEALRAGPLGDAAIAEFIAAKTEELGDAQARNFERWPILGQYVPWNAYVGETWQDELDYLQGWISERAAWLDANFGGAC